ncbi:MAG: hypothetical protein A2096_15750 [Spirochaetes bacterium GWF1_41_5]|nr:MAG: hypothetical protein A2096_15750 [Spirochaetes bacterium GWF1_41_5]
MRIDEKAAGRRLDIFLHGLYPEWSREKIKKYINKASLNSKPAKFSAHLKNGDFLEYFFEEDSAASNCGILPEDLPVKILYEDRFLLVIDKPQGMRTHPAGCYRSGTVVNFLLDKINRLEFPDPERAGIIHRLDKDTCGVLLCARDSFTLSKMQEQFKKREIKKIYTLITEGSITRDCGRIEKKIRRSRKNRKIMIVHEQGKDAITDYRVLKRFRRHTLVQAEPITGRTHQIRVHFQSIGYPLLGDPVYGRRNAEIPMCLCASSLSFRHPVTGQRLEISAELPGYFMNIADML